MELKELRKDIFKVMIGYFIMSLGQVLLLLATLKIFG